MEVMALAINLAVNKRNAQLICEGHGLRVLMQRAFHYQDALIMKMIRNISQHDGEGTKNLFIEFIGDIADAVQRAEFEEFRVECLGILGNLNISDLDYVRMLEEYDLVPWMLERLRPGRSDDDLVLEIVVLLGTCASDTSAAMLICKSGLLTAMIDLLKAKQEDDEMVLQVVYVFHLLCSHEETRSFILQETDAVAYLIDLMHDKNPQVIKSKFEKKQALTNAKTCPSSKSQNLCKKCKIRKFLAFLATLFLYFHITGANLRVLPSKKVTSPCDQQQQQKLLNS